MTTLISSERLMIAPGFAASSTGTGFVRLERRKSILRETPPGRRIEAIVFTSVADQPSRSCEVADFVGGRRTTFALFARPDVGENRALRKLSRPCRATLIRHSDAVHNSFLSGL